MSEYARVSVSMTETPQFRRLVAFVFEVDRYATDAEDYELAAMVRELLDDLLAQAAGG